MFVVAERESAQSGSLYLVQLLFCLFAEDVQLLPNAVFSKMVAAGVRNPARFDRDATELLTAMNTGGSAFVLCAVVYAVSI